MRLHDRMSAGEGESVGADEIRDRMDAPWRRLSPREIDLVDRLSADLYHLA